MSAEVKVRKQTRLMLHFNVQLEHILDDHAASFALPPAAATRFLNCAFNVAQLQVRIHEHYQSQLEPKPLFAATSKLHMLLHSALLAQYIDPALVWRFKGEDMMRITQKMAKACVHGLQGPAAMQKMGTRYRYAVHRQFLKY